MIETFREMIRQQYEAALSTLNRAIQNCSDAKWNEPVANWAFSHSAFHALFFTDLYLGNNDDAFYQQPFHLEHKEIFGDYPELEDTVQSQHYDRGFVEKYLNHCREKVENVVGGLTVESVSQPSPFRWIPATQGEVHVYNIRHLQHHAAQMVMRLRLDGQQQFPWFKTGWEE